MKQKILIDDYFKQALGEAEERLNLGAWANMERMLEGENPYEKEKDKKKPIFYILSAIALLSVLLFGVQQYLQVQPNSNIASNVVAKNSPIVVTTPSNVQKPSEVNIDVANKIEDDAANLNTNDNEESITTKTEQNSTTPIHKSNKPTYNNLIKNKSIKNDDKVVNPSNIGDAIVLKNNNTTSTAKDELNAINSNQFQKKSTINIATKIEAINTKNAIEASNKLVDDNIKKDKKSKQLFSKKSNENVASDKLNIEALNNDLLAKGEKLKLNKFEFAKTNIKATIKNIFNNKKTKKVDGNATVNINSLKVPDSINAVVINTKTSKQNGKKITTIDTISQFKMAKPEVKVVATNEQSNVLKPIIAPEKSNPRLVKATLSKAEQLKADAIAAKGANNKNKKQLATENKNEMMASALLVNEKNANDKIKSEINKKIAPQHKLNKALSDKILATIEKAKALGHLDIGSFRIPVNPGMFVGINATLLNTQHDFGGFQMGANLAMQLKRNLQFIPHIGLYYRNSGGYSVKDTAVTITQKSGPIRFGTQDVFSYQSSQNAYTYNFKHYLSIEMPLILQYDVKDWGFYGGINLAYGFKLNPTQYSPKNYTVTKFDTVSQSAPYVFAADKGTYFKSPDFNARFGLGYALGINYQINNNLYVDARYVHNTWVNSTTASSNDISKQQFLKGSIQLSMGYRFNETDRYK
jgi:Outer membrane protein beta-barrel domain